MQTTEQIHNKNSHMHVIIKQSLKYYLDINNIIYFYRVLMGNGGSEVSTDFVQRDTRGFHALDFTWLRIVLCVHIYVFVYILFILDYRYLKSEDYVQLIVVFQYNTCYIAWQIVST